MQTSLSTLLRCFSGWLRVGIIFLLSLLELSPEDQLLLQGELVLLVLNGFSLNFKQQRTHFICSVRRKAADYEPQNQEPGPTSTSNN